MGDAIYVVAPPAASNESQTDVVQPLESIAARSLYNPLKLDVHCTATASGLNGMAGSPVPYRLRNDSLLTILLLLCFVFFIVSLARSKPFLARQLRNFLRKPGLSHDTGESGGEIGILVFLSVVNAMVLAIATSLLLSDIFAKNILMQEGIAFIAAVFAGFMLYYCMKWAVGSFVNIVFFGVKKNLQWMALQLQVSAYDGVLLFPIIALLVYFDLSVENAIIYIVVVLFLNKIITFYKSYQIFFQGNGLYMQTFLYFCALEIVPLLAFGCAWLAIIDLIQINF